MTCVSKIILVLKIMLVKMHTLVFLLAQLAAEAVSLFPQPLDARRVEYDQML